MRISTNTASCMVSRGKSGLIQDAEALALLKNAGFDTVDLSFVFQAYPEFILHGPDWEEKVEALGLAAQRLGVTFNQCHFPYIEMRKPIFRENGYAEMFAEATRRAYWAASILHIPCGVVHPQTYPHLNHERRACLEENRRWLDPYIELGVKLGVATAIENMPPLLDKSYPMRYCMHYDDLIELVDSFQDPQNVGICWDTGHGNLARLDQARALRAVGSRLIALHINDNHGQDRDEHLLPYLGTNDWDAILRTLIEIGYKGDLTYEVGMVSKLAPAGDFQNHLLRATWNNAQDLLKRYRELCGSAQ